MATTTTTHPAAQAVRDLADDHEKVLAQLEDFCERFYWIKDHADYREEVRAYLAGKGAQCRTV